jgi:uncharacterized cupredoxin-like copper-binding protein
MRMRRVPFPLLLSCCLLAVGTGASTAGGGTSGVQINEYDFGIQAPKAVHPGEVTFVVRNQGPDDHELIVVRETRGRPPLRRDGLTVDEQALAKVTAGGLEPGSPGNVRRLRVTLQPGRYVLFCNMSGHYLGGMHTVLIVG